MARLGWMVEEGLTGEASATPLDRCGLCGRWKQDSVVGREMGMRRDGMYWDDSLWRRGQRSKFATQGIMAQTMHGSRRLN